MTRTAPKPQAEQHTKRMHLHLGVRVIRRRRTSAGELLAQACMWIGSSSGQSEFAPPHS